MSYRPITDMWFLARAKLKGGVKYYGAYLGGFPERARALLGCKIDEPVLHVCGGMAKLYPYRRALSKLRLVAKLLESNRIISQDAKRIFTLGEQVKHLQAENKILAKERDDANRIKSAEKQILIAEIEAHAKTKAEVERLKATCNYAVKELSFVDCGSAPLESLARRAKVYQGKLEQANKLLQAEVERLRAQIKRPANGWCKGFPLPDGNYTGCACDCPACEEAVKNSVHRELLAPTIELLEDWIKYMKPYTGFINSVSRTKVELARLKAIVEKGTETCDGSTGTDAVWDWPHWTMEKGTE